VVRGQGEQLEAWRSALGRVYAPRRLVVAIAADATGLPAALAAKPPRDRTVAYVCRGPVCSEPVDRLDAHGLTEART